MTLPHRVGRLMALAIIAMLLAAPSAALADDALARQHFRKGVDLYDKKQYDAALEAFRAAYAEKPSPGIKQNIALCLKGLGQPVKAASAFDEALAEGADTLKPDVRAAIEKELAELSKIVATVHIVVISSTDKKPIENVTVSVDGAPLAPDALRRPVRLEPGIHVFTAHADGLADPPQKKLSILAGSPVDATFQLGASLGTLTILPNVADAVVEIDGVRKGVGPWTGEVPAGAHHVTVSAPSYQTTSTDVVVSTGASSEYKINLLHPGEQPAEYAVPLRPPPPPPKKRYIVPMLAYEGESLRLGTVLDEQAGGSQRNFTGAAFAVRGGYRLSRYFALELYGDVGQVSEKYAIANIAVTSETKVLHWQVTPGVRFATTGSVRFMLASGIGLHGLSVQAEIRAKRGVNDPEMTSSHKGTGLSAAWLNDIGMQIDIGSLFLEGAAFFTLHGVGTARDKDTGDRFFYSSPGFRAGVRVGLGIPF